MLSIHYQCRHCGVKLGTLEVDSIDTERLGLNKLTDEERQDMVSYQSSGDIHIKSICEDCHESFDKNPEYYQNDFLIH